MEKHKGWGFWHSSFTPWPGFDTWDWPRVGIFDHQSFKMSKLPRVVHPPPPQGENIDRCIRQRRLGATSEYSASIVLVLTVYIFLKNEECAEINDKEWQVFLSLAKDWDGLDMWKGQRRGGVSWVWGRW